MDADRRIAELESELAAKDGRIAERDARIAELAEHSGHTGENLPEPIVFSLEDQFRLGVPAERQ